MREPRGIAVCVACGSDFALSPVRGAEKPPTRCACGGEILTYEEAPLPDVAYELFWLLVTACVLSALYFGWRVWG